MLQGGGEDECCREEGKMRVAGRNGGCVLQAGGEDGCSRDDVIDMSRVVQKVSRGVQKVMQRLSYEEN